MRYALILIFSGLITIVQAQVEVVITFEEAPSCYTLIKAPFKYNKQAAYSLTLDDGYESSYTNVFALFEGGIDSVDKQMNEGVFYTDGCGNDIPFRAGVSWNSGKREGDGRFTDLHDGSDDNYMLWSEASELYNHGWDFFNHAFQHLNVSSSPSMVFPDSYISEIVKNYDYTLQRTGINLDHFIIPSGDMNYQRIAFDYGIKGLFSHNISTKTMQVDDNVDLYQLSHGREFLNDYDHNSGNIMNWLNDVMLQCDENTHLWYNDFTHDVHGRSAQVYDLSFGTFKYYMQTIDTLYGHLGEDNLWVAPLQTVYEYLKVKQTTILAESLVENVLTITLDETNIPDDLKTYTLSLLVNSESNITDITIDGDETSSSNIGSGLVNITWNHTINMPSITMDGASIRGFVKGQESYLLPIYNIRSTVGDSIALDVIFDNQELVDSIDVDYISPNATAYLTIYPIQGDTGTVLFTVNATAIDGAQLFPATVTHTAKIFSIDTENPSPPENLVFVDSTGTSITVSWDPAVDNQGIGMYQMYLNGSANAYVTGTEYTFDNLTANNYLVQVKSIDYQGNLSGKSGAISVRISGINGLEESALINKVYPNPARDLVTIETETSVHICLMDIYGNLLREKISTGHVTLPIALLSQGVYLLRIQSTDGRQSFKRLIVE